MENIEEFNEITVCVLGKLYTAFPQKIDFNVGDYKSETTSNTKINFRETVAFLQNEGFIQTGLSTGNPNEFYRVNLTMKGLNVLDSVPLSLKETESLGKKSQSIIKVGFKEVGKEAIKTVVSEIFKAVAT